MTTKAGQQVPTESMGGCCGGGSRDKTPSAAQPESAKHAHPTTTPSTAAGSKGKVDSQNLKQR